MSPNELNNIMDILNGAFKTKAEMFSPRLLGSVFGDMPWVLPDLWEHKHTAIYGRKGTGKSMLLRYLSLPVQLRLLDDHDDKKFEVTCWGQYIILAKGSLPQCSDTSFDTQDYEKIFGHWFNLRLADAFLDNLDECEIAHRTWFRNGEMQILKSFGEAVGIKELCEATSFKEGREVVYRLTNSVTEFVSSAETSECILLEKYRHRHNYSGEVHTPEMFLTHLCEVLNTERSVRTYLPVFLLLDQWDSLLPQQRKVLYPLFNNRFPQQWFMKVGSVRPYDSDLPPIASDELAILNVEVDADGPGYAKLCRDALDARLKLMQDKIKEKDRENNVLNLLMQQPKDLFPTYTAADQYRDGAKRMRGSDTLALFDDQCDAETQGHFSLLKAGISPLYCGIDTMICLSSGFLRVFLELVHRVLKHALSAASTAVECNSIPYDWQDRAIRMECAELFDQKLKADTASLCPGDNNLPKDVQTWVKNVNQRFYKTFELGSREPALHRIELRLTDDDPACEEADKFVLVLVATGVLTPELSWNSIPQGKLYRVSRSYALNAQLPLTLSREPLRLNTGQFLGLKDENRGRSHRAEALSMLQTSTFFATAFREGEWQTAVRNTLRKHIFPKFGLDYQDGEPYDESSQEIGRKVREMMRRMELFLFDITDENENVCFEFGMGVAHNRPCYLIMNTAISGATKRQKESKVFPIQYTRYEWPQDERDVLSTGTVFDSLFKAIKTVSEAYQKKANKDANPLDEKLPKDYTPIPGQIYVHVWTEGRILTWERDIHNMIRALNLNPTVVATISPGMTLKKYTEAAAHSSKCIVDTSGCDRLACAVLGYVFMRDRNILAVYDRAKPGIIANWLGEDAYRSYSSKDELLEIVKCFLQAQ